MSGFWHKQMQYGGRSSVGRAQDCGSWCRGFDPLRPPHIPENARHCLAFLFKARLADVVKLVDTPDLGSGAARCESSSLSVRTTYYSFENSQRSPKRPQSPVIGAFLYPKDTASCGPGTSPQHGERNCARCAGRSALGVFDQGNGLLRAELGAALGDIGIEQSSAAQQPMAVDPS